MIRALLLAASLWGQDLSSSTLPTANIIENIKLKNLAEEVRQLQSGRPTITGQPKFQDGVTFNDNTTQVTAYLVAASSRSSPILVNTDYTATTFGTAVNGSTLTITLAQESPVAVSFAGQVSNNNSSGGCGLSILIDGAFPSGYSTSRAITSSGNGTTANNVFPVNFTFETESLSAGEHKFSVVGKAISAGTCAINCTFSSVSSCKMSVREIR